MEAPPALEVEDYEALPDSLSTGIHMVAGATAGITEHCIMYPIDLIKTRMQAINPSTNARYTGVFNALRTITMHEGFGRTFYGMPAVIAGSGPSHALYFACYEKLKWVISERKQSTVLATVVAGCCATLFHDGIMVPFDVIKQRMQMYNSPFKNSFDCAITILRQEGIGAFFRSYTTQLTMNIPFQVAHFSIYEQCQNLLNYDRVYSPMSHCVSGGIAGAFAAWVTNPFDVCKTLLNTQEICCASGKPVKQGLFAAAQTVWRCRGWQGFFRGSQARMIFQMPSTALSWSVYEFFKFALGQGWHQNTADETDIGNTKTQLMAPIFANDKDKPQG